VLTAILLETTVPSPDLSGLAQYGAVGILLLASLGWLMRAWVRLENRCDRLETELREQNRLMTDRVIVVLTQATTEIARMVEDQRRRSR